MGFGLLFIGYLIAFAGAFLPQISALAYVLGSGIILFSLRKLIFENKWFIVAISFSLLLEISSISFMAIQLLTGGNTLSTVCEYVATSSAILFNIFLMVAIFALARCVEASTTKILAIVSGSFALCGGILFVLCSTIQAEYALARLNLLHFIFTLLAMVISAVTIFNAYVRICYEGDENMQKESSGIPIFDALNKLFDKAFAKKNDKGKK